ncbi:protein NDRG3-like isoform X2 [Ptychodera flava]|uniref:protein NDRG3-like isoform X2 n=1 Tax=Ptychodera flava TaxID=63121 RepID=UPI00396A988F
MDNIELHDVEVTQAAARSLDRISAEMPLLANTSSLPGEEDVETGIGTIHVATQGDRKKAAIITYHDIGLNHVSQFQGFCSYIDMQPILNNFCVYHVNAPGQEEGANTLPHSFVYPTMEQLAEALLPVIQHFGIKSFVGFGVGAGANILCRFALAHPEKVNGLFLVNCISTAAGWVEWGYQKISSFYLRGNKITKFSEDYLLWHHFGKKTLEINHDLVHVYKESMLRNINPYNLSCFIESYIKRTGLEIRREMDPEKKKVTPQLRCLVMLVSGASSPHIDDTVQMNGRLDPGNSNWLKLSDCGGMVLEEQPGKVCEAFRLFLQGIGYVPSLSMTSLKRSRTESSTSSHCSPPTPARASRDSLGSASTQPMC